MELHLTKLDVLDELDEIKMCVQYELDGKKIDYLPAAVEDQLKIKPIYKTFPGWKTSTNGIKNIDDFLKMQKIIFMQLKILLELKYQVFLQVQNEKIQY
jgi:adenylosuccinate synthase